MFKRLSVLCLIALVGSLLAACQSEQIIEAFVPEDARPVAEQSVDGLINRDMAMLRAVVPDGATEEQLASLEATLPTLFPLADYGEPKLVGANRSLQRQTDSEPLDRLELVYLVPSDDGDRRLELVLQMVGENTWRLTWLNAFEAEHHPSVSLDWETNSFTRNMALLLPLASFTFVLGTLIASFRFKRIKRRILWTVFILSSYPVFEFNWSTEIWTMVAPAITSSEGSVDFKLISLTFLGAGFEDYAPLEAALITVGFPFGALFFWYRVMRGGPTRKPDEEERLRG